MTPPSPLPPGNDPALMARVLSALEHDPSLGLTALSVEYVEGSLVPRGQAGSAEARDNATTVAARVSPGVPIENRIRVG